MCFADGEVVLLEQRHDAILCLVSYVICRRSSNVVEAMIDVHFYLQTLKWCCQSNGVASPITQLAM